ncbi:MAG TPA: type IV pilus twitching motility protein PilT [Myxococcales bacterium]|jgi:twitching motility protein PilT
MEQRTFNQLLAAAVKNGASDIHLKAGAPPALRISGSLLPVKVPALMPEDTENIARFVLANARWKGDIHELRDWDTSYAVDDVGRFRVNIFRQKGNCALVLRAIPFNVPTVESLGLPPVVKAMADFERGLVLVTGVTGSGKSSTLAAILRQINETTRAHILTIEDPIEFLHEDKLSRITQREIGPDTSTFANALRAALRQDPDVILVGEMRDVETIDIALKASETGHLVLSTVHTTDAAKTIGRLCDAFPADAQEPLRHRLAENLKGTISQRLLPKAQGKGRVVAAEIMVSTEAIKEYITDPERTHEITDYLAKNRDVYGTQSFDQHLSELYKAGAITLDVAKAAASNPSDFERALSFE